MTKLVTNKLKTHFVDQLVESVNETSNTIYYVFAGKHTEFDDPVVDIPTPENSEKSTRIDIFKDMIFGKRVINSGANTNIYPMVKRYNWTANTAYAMYDHTDEDLYDKKFFVTVEDEGNYDRHVFKCLGNANGALSTIAPDPNDAGFDSAFHTTNDDYYETQDGYQWKFMYTIDSVTFDKFATQNYVPVVPDANVVSRAADGSIDVIRITDHGLKYDNYFAGEFTSTNQIQIGGNVKKYLLVPQSNTVNQPNNQINFYSNTVMYITDGNVDGEYVKILSSNATADGVEIVIDAQFTEAPDLTTKFVIYPEVKVTGDGNETVEVVAYAVVNATSANSIHKVVILEPGAGYTSATGTVLRGSSSTYSNAEITPIISPLGGHGYRAAEELAAAAVGISVAFANTESDKITIDNVYRQVGLIKNPRYMNVELGYADLNNANVAGSTGVFTNGERFYQIKTQRMFGNVGTTNGNNVYVAESNTAAYNDFLIAGDFVYLKSSDGLSNFIANVTNVSVANSTANAAITTDVDIHFTDTAVEVHLVKVIAEGLVNNAPVVETGDFFIAQKVSGILVKNEMIIGGTSYSCANIHHIDINEKYANSATFETFSQLTALVASTSVAGFANNINKSVEQIEDDVISASAMLHSIDTATNTLYVTNIQGTFEEGSVVYGTEGETLPSITILNKYVGDIDVTSGDILFIKNNAAISRSNTSSEQIKIILEF